MASSFSKADIKWALAHLVCEGDSDLFPRPPEIELLNGNRAAVEQFALALDIVHHKWQEPRRSLIPKSELSFRSGVQLDPVDSLLFSALIRRNAKRIEKHRSDPNREHIFSYRVALSPKGTLYGEDLYKTFWKASKRRAKKCSFVLLTDVTDFYNQIYHHTIEQELQLAKVEKREQTALLNLLKTCSVTVSRGIPIGPHASHLLAEISMRPIDQMLSDSGIWHHRFVDDFHIFCDSRSEAQQWLQQLAATLDLSKLHLNKMKTKILSSDDFIRLCDDVLIEKPINDAEAKIIKGVQSAALSPYGKIQPAKVTPALKRALTGKNIRSIFESYMAESDPDFVRLRWFIRRLTQTGDSVGVDYIIDNFDSLAPAMGDCCRYLRVAIEDYSGDKKSLGEKLEVLLDSPMVGSNEYLRSLVLNLFASIAELNHIDKLTKRFAGASVSEQREIVFAALRAKAAGWLRTLKPLSHQDPWLRRAIMLGALTWSEDERHHWIRTHKGRYGFLADLVVSGLKSKTAAKKTQRLLASPRRSLRSV